MTWHEWTGDHSGREGKILQRMDYLQGAKMYIERESQGIVRIVLSFVNAMVWLL